MFSTTYGQSKIQFGSNWLQFQKAEKPP
jgi:hypothetical protein